MQSLSRGSLSKRRRRTEAGHAARKRQGENKGSRATVWPTCTHEGGGRQEICNGGRAGQEGDVRRFKAGHRNELICMRNRAGRKPAPEEGRTQRTVRPVLSAHQRTTRVRQRDTAACSLCSQFFGKAGNVSIAASGRALGGLTAIAWKYLLAPSLPT